MAFCPPPDWSYEPDRHLHTESYVGLTVDGHRAKLSLFSVDTLSGGSDDATDWIIKQTTPRSDPSSVKVMSRDKFTTTSGLVGTKVFMQASRGRVDAHDYFYVFDGPDHWKLFFWFDMAANDIGSESQVDAALKTLHYKQSH